MTEQEILEQVRQAIIDGEPATATSSTQQALDSGIAALEILHAGVMQGAEIVGQRFEAGEFFLPELMLAGRALKAAMQVLTPALQSQGNVSLNMGVVVIATIQTDIHDIGKNMVSSMLSAAGFQVIDLGVDVPIKEIISRAVSEKADIIALSALLTTSLPYMQDLVRLLEAMGERKKFMVMVGGASVTPSFCERIGADGTASNAVEAVRLARELIQKLEKE